MLALALLALCGTQPRADDPPADRQVLRSLPPLPTVPRVVETYRDDIVIVKNRLAPFVWECTAYSRLTVEVPLLKLRFTLPTTHRVRFSRLIA